MTQVIHLTKPIDMKFTASKDVDSQFKFNPCAVPFIPSVERNVGSTGMDVLRVDTGQGRWNPALREPTFNRFAEFLQMEEDQSTSCSFYNFKNENDISAEKVFDCETQSEGSCEMFNQPSSSEIKLSSWLQEEFFLNESCGGSSVCDESISVTPVSSASPPLTEDQDRNSVSYGSLPLSSFLLGDLTQSHSGSNLGADPLLSSSSKTAPMPMDNAKEKGDVMRYYSPFGTGVSTWLADGKITRKEGVKGMEENDGKIDVEEEILKFGKVWNDEDSSSREADSPGDSWMRQISVDEDSSLFTRSESKDMTDDSVQLPAWEFPGVLNPNPWLDATDKGRRSLSNWNGLGGSTKWNSQTSKKVLEEAFPPAMVDKHLRFCADQRERETKLPCPEMNQFASPVPGFDFVQRGNCQPRSNQKMSATAHQLRRQPPAPYNQSENLGVLPETMFYMPHLVPGMMNHPGAVPIIYVPGPTVHGHASQQAMLNPFLHHMAPFPGFVNFDYHTAMPQFYQTVEQMAYFGFGNKNPFLASVARHTGPALELHQQLDQCYDQFRQLENERKKVEAEMARQHPGKVVSSDNALPVPQMPPNPSRIDRLIVEVLREHARVVTLVSRMEEVRAVRFRRSLLAVFDYWMDGAHKLQTCRKNEIINRKKYRLDSRGLLQKEKDVLALATSLSDLAVSTRRTRTALWCGMQLSSSDLPKQCMRMASAVAKRSSASDTPMMMCNEIDEAESEFGADEEEYNECNDYDDELSKNSDHQEVDSEVGDEACFEDELENNEGQNPLYRKVDRKSDYEILAKLREDLVGKVCSAGSNVKQFRPLVDEDQTEQCSDEPIEDFSIYETDCAEAGKNAEEDKSYSDEAKINAFSDDSEV